MASDQLLWLAFVLIASCMAVLSKRKKNKGKPGLSLPPSPRALPIIGHLHLLKPVVHQAFRDLSAQYGPLIYLKLGYADFVVANTPELAKEILKTHELTYSSRKMNTAINLVTYDNATFAFAPYDTYWKFMKKLSTTELLGARTIRQFLPGRAREVHGFITGLMDKAQARESVNLTLELLKLSNNVISQMMLSIKSSGSDSHAEQARSLVREVTEIFGEFNVSDFIKIFKKLDVQGFKKRAMDLHKRYDAFLEKIISDREELRRQQKKKKSEVEDGEEKVRDFLDILLDVAVDKDCEITITRNHIKSLILVSLYHFHLFGYALTLIHFSFYKRKGKSLYWKSTKLSTNKNG